MTVQGDIRMHPDFLSGTSKREVSTDGKTWKLFWEAKFVKAQPAGGKLD